jgi:hypothetical protein
VWEFFEGVLEIFINCGEKWGNCFGGEYIILEPLAVLGPDTLLVQKIVL